MRLSDIGGSSLAMGTEDLLRRLPEKVMKNGRVVDIRASVRDRLAGGGAGGGAGSGAGSGAGGGVDIVQTSALDTMTSTAKRSPLRDEAESPRDPRVTPRRCCSREGSPADGTNPERATPRSRMAPTGRSDKNDQITTLRVRLEAGARPLLLKMRFADTVGELARAVSRHLKISVEDFELRTAFPNRAYTDMGEGLEAAGLVPNATIMLRKFTLPEPR